MSDSTVLTPRSPYWNYGETETGPTPAWEDLSSERRGDLASRMAIYAAMVDRMDQQIDRIVADLREKGELENTLLVFTSDNGACAEWDPRGFDGKSSNDNTLHTGAALARMGGPDTCHSVGSGWANASNTPWRLYKHFNHEGGIASPGIVHWPAKLDAAKGGIHETPAHIIDIVPTLLAAAGAKVAETDDLPPVGVDLVPQLLGEKAGERALFFEHEGHRAVRTGQWKLVALKDGPWELYDFTTDRTELRDLASRRPETVETLSALWDGWAETNRVTPLPEDLQVEYLKRK